MSNFFENWCQESTDENTLHIIEGPLKWSYLLFKDTCNGCIYQQSTEGYRGHGGGNYCKKNEEFYYSMERIKGLEKKCRYYVDDIGARYRLIALYFKYYKKVHRKRDKNEKK